MAGTEALGPLMDRWGDADLILVLTSPVWTLRREREKKSGFSWTCYSPRQSAETRWQKGQWSLKLSSDCAYLKLEGVTCLEWAAIQS